MKNNHEIFMKIQHKRVQNELNNQEEQFDLFNLGIFKVSKSILGFLSNEKLEQVDEIVELVRLETDSIYKPHYHKQSSAVIYIVIGTGMLMLGDEKITYCSGMRIDVPKLMPHGFITAAETLFLSIQTPPILNRDTGDVDLYYVD